MERAIESFCHAIAGAGIAAVLVLLAGALPYMVQS